MPTFYNSIHKILGKLFYSENFYIALLDEQREKLELKYFVDQKEKTMPDEKAFSVTNKSLSSLLFRSDKPLLINRDDFLRLEKEELVERVGPACISWLGVPLRENNRSIGVMVVQSYSDDVIYQPWHRDLLEYVSQQVAVTLHRKQTKESLESIVKERTSKLEQEIENHKKSQETQSALYLIANLANMDLKLHSFYKELHNIISGLIYCENFFIALKNEETDCMDFVYYEDSVDDFDVDSIAQIPFRKIKNSLTYYVMKSGCSLLATNDELQSLAEKENLDILGEETVSWLGIPLSINGDVIGVMALQSYLPDFLFSKDDKELMVFVGQHIATALERNRSKDYLRFQVEERTEELKESNIKLTQQIEETERSKKLQTALYQIADLASSAQNMEELYVSIHKIIAELIYANNIYIGLYDESKKQIDFVYFVDTQDYLNKDTVKHISESQLKQTATGYVLKTGDSFLKTPKNKQEQVELGIKSIGKEAIYWLGVALKIESDIIGILVVQSYDEEIVFGRWHKELLEFVSHHIAITLERKQAQKALQKRVDERTAELAKSNESLKLQIVERKRSEDIQAALYNIANLANQNIELESLFKKIHKIISQLIYSENFYIAIVDKKNDDIEWVYIIDSEKRYNQKLLKSLPKEARKKSIAKQLIVSKKSIMISQKEIIEMDRKGIISLVGPAAESFLGVPLIGANGTIGAMAVQSYDRNIEYCDADKELLKFVAYSIVSTIERREYNRKLEERVARRTRELTVTNKKLQVEISQRKESEKLQTALFKIAETPQLCQTEKELYSRLHQIISRLMYVESFYIARVDVENQCLNFDYVYDDIDKDVPKSVPLGRSLTSYVYKEGRIIHINREQVRELEKSGNIEHFGTYATDWVGVPLISGGSVYGIMVLQSYDAEHIYGDREIEIINFVSTHITEALQQKHAEQRLQNAYAELAEKTKKAEEANEAKSSFLATVSHEIRTPMNGILGMLSLIADTNMSVRQRDYVSKISTSANSLLGIINDILDFSKIEQGKLELEYIEFEIIDILDNLVDLFSSRINERGLRFYIDLRPEVKLSRIGDPLRLSQVLINLIGNAVKFTEKGFIRLTIKEPEPRILVFEVRDSGIGIEPEKRDKIFSSFTQADDTTTRKFGGSGLGLSICQQLVTLMGGVIDVTGKVGQGSCFCFDINLSYASEKNDQSLADARVLLITDDMMQLNTWRNFCELFKLQFLTLTSDEINHYKETNQLLPNDLSHIFIDDDIEKHQGLDTLESVNQVLTINKPCFLLIQPSPQLSEMPAMGEYVQLIPKPAKMGVILGLIQNKPDIVKVLQAAKSTDDRVNHKLFGKDILLVEDNAINQQVAKEILEKAGVNVKIAENGLEAVKECHDNRFDLVLMDMQMPVMDGYQASLTIRRSFSPETLPIVAMTANVMKGDREKCISHGMNDYIGKPINRIEFFRVIEQYLCENKNSGRIAQQELPISEANKVELSNNSEPEKISDFSLKELADKFDSLELAKQLIKIFIESHQNDEEIILKLLAKSELNKAQEKVHKLKGSAGELGLTQLYLQCSAMDSKLKNNTMPSEKRLDDFTKTISRDLDNFLKICKDF